MMDNNNDFHFDDIDEFCNKELSSLISEITSQKNKDVEIIDDINNKKALYTNSKEDINIIDILEDVDFDVTSDGIINIDASRISDSDIEVLDDFDFNIDDSNEKIEILDDFDNQVVDMDISNDKIEILDDFDNTIINIKINDKGKLDKNKIKKIYLYILLILMVIALIFVIIKILFWKADNDSINKQIESINNKTDIVEIEDSSDVVIVDPIQSDPINNEVVVDKNNDYFKFIEVPLINVDFNNLLEMNSDTVGWLQVPNTNINYPVVKKNDNEYYLNHSFDKKYNDAGWIFADYRNNLIDDKNLVIYGHARLNSTMFGTLKNVIKSDWYTNSNNHVIRLSTPYVNSSWQVFSTYVIDPEDYYIKTSFDDDESYIEFLSDLKDRSVYNYNVNLNVTDRILTLSTCYSNNRRVVLHAKLIKYENR